MYLEQDDKILFLGNLKKAQKVSNESLCGFQFISAAALAAKFPDLNLSFVNKSHLNDNSQNIMLSLDEKCISERPSVVILCIGQQDALLAEKQHEQASLKEYSRFNRVLRQLIEEIQANSTRRIIILEPFLLDTNNIDRALRPDINQKIQIVREVARDYKCKFVALDGHLNELAIENGTSAYVEEDGTYKLAVHHEIAKKIVSQFYE